MVAWSVRLEPLTCLEGGIQDTANKVYSWDTQKIPNAQCRRSIFVSADKSSTMTSIFVGLPVLAGLVFDWGS